MKILVRSERGYKYICMYICDVYLYRMHVWHTKKYDGML